MKRMAAAVLAAMMVFSLAACAGAEEETEIQEQTQTREQTQADTNTPDADCTMVSGTINQQFIVPDTPIR